MPHASQQSQGLVDTIPLKKPHTSSGQRPTTIAKVQPGANPMLQSPGGADQPSIGQKTGTLHLAQSAYRPPDTSEERRGQKGPTTLVPNFRSISPSIFNIDLNQTGDRSNLNGQPISPNSASGSNQQPIYVSINPRKSDANGANTSQIGNTSNMRVKRIGPLNKGDKIKFGVVVPREQKKRKTTSSEADFLQRHEIFETPKQLQRVAQVAIGKHSDQVNRVMA